MNRMLRLSVFVTAMLTAHSGLAAKQHAAALHPATQFQLTAGTPLFQEMDEKGGIADTLDADAKKKVSFADYAAVQAARANFEDEVFKKVMPLFAKGEKGFQALVEALAGQEVSEHDAVPAIAKALQDGELLKDTSKVGLAATRLAPLLMLTSGGGTEIALNENVITYHYGFKPGDDSGEEEATVNRKRTKSGRSYALTANRGALDPSDVFFLTETAAFVEKTKNPWPAYQVVFEILTASDASGVAKLPRDAQVVVADWFAIYVAEQRRHRMTGWTRMDWENSLTELLMLAPYTADAKQIRNVEGDTIAGRLVDYFGVGTDGSGLGGRAGIQRRAYTRDISKLTADLHPEEAQALATLIGAKKGTDLVSGVMKFVNDRDNEKEVKAHAGEITEAAVSYLKVMRESAEDIAKRLQP